MTLPRVLSWGAAAVAAVLLWGRAYPHRVEPELALRLVRGADYRFGEWILLKPALAVHGRRRLRRLDRRPR